MTRSRTCKSKYHARNVAHFDRQRELISAAAVRIETLRTELSVARSAAATESALIRSELEAMRHERDVVRDLPVTLLPFAC